MIVQNSKTSKADVDIHKESTGSGDVTYVAITSFSRRGEQSEWTSKEIRLRLDVFDAIARQVEILIHTPQTLEEERV